MKKLTRTSLSALRNAKTVLTKQQQKAIRGGCSLDEMGTGYWIGDNYYWERTSECICGGSYNYGNGGNGSNDYYYGYMGSDNPISQDEFYRLLEEGNWYGGYVEEWGYVFPEITVYGYESEEPSWDCVFQCMAYLDPSRSVEEYILAFREKFYDPQSTGGVFNIDYKEAFDSAGFYSESTNKLYDGSNYQLIEIKMGDGRSHMVVYKGTMPTSDTVLVYDPVLNREYEVHRGRISQIINVMKKYY